MLEVGASGGGLLGTFCGSGVSLLPFGTAFKSRLNDRPLRALRFETFGHQF